MVIEKNLERRKRIKNCIIICIALMIGFYAIAAILLNPYDNTRYNGIARRINNIVIKKQRQSFRLLHCKDYGLELHLIIKGNSKKKFSQDDIKNAYDFSVDIANLLNENKQNHILPDSIIIQLNPRFSPDGNFRIKIRKRDDEYIVEEASLSNVCSFSDLEGLSGIYQIWFGNPGTVDGIDFFSEFTNLEQITFAGWQPDADIRQELASKFHSMVPECKIIWTDSNK
ncbi:MAG: hypothetical protein WCD89_20365 [Anaerocolumna sp.]